MPDPVEIIAALLLGSVLTLGSALSGTQPELCALIGGTYQKGAPDVCPDGQWKSLVGLGNTVNPQ